MKNYTITVNGTEYQVTVEETTGTGQVPVKKAEAPVAPATVIKPTPEPQVPVIPKTAAVGAVKINAPMPGKIVAVKSNPGDAVVKGQVLLVLEAMKMENDITAQEDGVVASIPVAVGSTVEAGEVLVTLN